MDGQAYFSFDIPADTTMLTNTIAFIVTSGAIT
jgi:hypothetical protein